MRRPPPAPRCGCCDRPSVLAVCEVCQEPTCAEHLRRVGPIGAPTYVCLVCVSVLRETRPAASPDLAGVAS